MFYSQAVRFRFCWIDNLISTGELSKTVMKKKRNKKITHDVILSKRKTNVDDIVPKLVK